MLQITAKPGLPGFCSLRFWETTQAQDSFCQALRVAIPVKSYLALFHILPGIALLYREPRGGRTGRGALRPGCHPGDRGQFKVVR